MLKVKFKDWDCVIEFHQYPNLRTALLLRDAETGEPIAKATINVPEQPLDDNEVIIKSYDENEGMLDTLVRAKIIAPRHRRIPKNHMLLPVCYLIAEDPNRA